MNKQSSVTASSSPVTRESSRLLIVGGKGMLAHAVTLLAPAGYLLTSVDLPEFDMTDETQIHSLVDKMKPDVIINCAAYTNVDGCETEQALATRVNGVAVGYLAEAAYKVDATLVHISTDYVFDGKKIGPYVETDETVPQSVYGKTKLLGEQAIRESKLKHYFIIRTSWLYGPGGNSFVETVLRLASERDELRIIHDQVGSPTYTCDLAVAVFALLGKVCDRETVMKGPLREVRDAEIVMKGPLREGSNSGSVTARSSLVTGSPSLIHPPYGLYHFANEGSCSWYEFACAIVEEAQKRTLPLKVQKIHPIATEDYPLPAKRPANSVFDKQKYKTATGVDIPGWRDSLNAYFLGREARS